VTAWADLAALLPGLRGTGVHVVAAKQEAELCRGLAREGFRMAVLEGATMSDEAAFFREAARTFRLGPGFGSNWDALADALGDLAASRDRRLAVLWRDADRCLERDVQTFVNGVLAFARAAEDLGGEDPPTQLAVFLLGAGGGFARGRVRRDPAV
jgi:RNAse (barnase) inhibitor barstar